MNVKQLIKELKAMPQDLEVGISMHDNTEYEIAGYAFAVMHFNKDNYTPDFVNRYDEEIFDDMNDCVIIKC